MSATRRPTTRALIDHYMADVNRRPCLDRAQETALARRLRQGDGSAAEALVVANLRFVVKVAHRYAGYGFNLLDLIQEGNVGLIEAVGRFDPERGYRLVSYAVWWIRAQIHNCVIRSWSLVKLGTTHEQRRLFFKLRAERERAEQAAQDQVSAEALAQRLGVDAALVREMETRLGCRDLSLDAPLDPDGTQTLLDAQSAADAGQDELLAAQQRRETVRAGVDAVRDRLNARERHVVDARLCADEPETLQQIGERFGVSRERVRQIENKVRQVLRQALAARGISAAA